MRPASIIAVVVSLLLVGPAAADDWPQWRGPQRDAVWHETGILNAFPADGLKIVWRAEVGTGFSSPIVADGRVFLTDVALSYPDPKERVLCFDAATGQPLWSHAYAEAYEDYGPDQPIMGPIPTPVWHSGKVYTLGYSQLHCLDAERGTVLWRKSLEAEYNSQPRLTYASPLIEGNLLIIYSGRFTDDATASLIALDKDSGATAWRAVTDYAAMSSPIVVGAAGKRQVIVWSQRAVTAVDAATGDVLWREETRPENQSSAVSTPVSNGDRLLIGGLMMRLDQDRPTARVLWPESKSPARRNLSITSTPMLRGDYVYSARTSGELVCLDAATGEEMWRNEAVTELGRGSSIHLTAHGEETLLFTDRGDLILARLSGAGYEEIGRARLLEPTFPMGGTRFAWSPPAYANKCVYARSDRELVCASLAE